MRFRIALTTALAVTGMITGIFTLSGSTPAASARSASYKAARMHRATTLPNTALALFDVPTKVHSSLSAALVVNGRTIAPIAIPVAVPVAPPVAATPPPPPPVPVTDANSVNTEDWTCIRVHESGDQYNNPADPSGAYGILISTWHEFGYSGWPYEAPASVQDHLALELHSLYGFHPWSSRYACGL